MDNVYIQNTKFKVIGETENGEVILQNFYNDYEKFAMPKGEFKKRFSMLSNVEEFKTITEYCQEAYKIALKNGFHDDYKPISVSLALIHSEVSEALEADRNGDSDNFIEELADICIRVFDLCGELGIDLEHAIEQKMEYNKTREYKHGKRY